MYIMIRNWEDDEDCEDKDGEDDILKMEKK